MYIKINFKNLFIFAMVLVFGYIAILIWTAEEDFPEVNVDFRDIAGYAILAATVGGKAITSVHEGRTLGILSKGKTAEGAEDLLTKADLISNHVILDVLGRFPGLNVLSEETETQLTKAEAEKYQDEDYSLGLSISKLARRLPSKKVNLSSLTVWVDPLDATQEFTEGLLEYVTVMVCVAEKGQPIFGVIHRPFANETWFGLDGFGVLTSDGQKWEPNRLNVTSRKILISRSHAGEVRDRASKAFGDEYTIESAGGAGYKVLRLANGTAALYLHTTVIKKWDICAGDAILRALGGAILDLDGSNLSYGADDHFVNKKGIFAAMTNPYTLYRKWRNVSTPQS